MTQTSSKIALIDMDGTLADYDGQLEQDLLGVAPNDRERVTRERRATPGWWEKLPLIQRGFDVTQTLHEMGFRIVILTKGPYRDTHAWSEKVCWCRDRLPKEWNIQVTITEDKSLVYGQVLFDDWPVYGTGWLQQRPRGLLLVPAHRWNDLEKSYPESMHSRILRFETPPSREEIEQRLVQARNVA